MDWNDKAQVKEYYKRYNAARKEKQSDYMRKYWKNPVKRLKLRQQHRQYYIDNKTNILKQCRDNYEENKQDRHLDFYKYRVSHSDDNKVRNVKMRVDTKLTVLSYYGGGKCACVKCGFSDIRALSIDHIEGGGSQHIKSLSTSLYNWLRKNHYPDGYQTLCMNCQFIKRVENGELIIDKKSNDNKIKQKQLQGALI